MKTYKGFDKDLKCRGFQYEIGKEYETENAECCKTGFHACEYPLDCLNYYEPTTSRYCEVEQSGEISKRNDEDTKVSSTKIKIGAEIGLAGLIKASIEYIKERATKKCKGSCLRSDRSVASNSGYRSVASNSGDSSVASNSGDRSVASNSGYSSVASNSGDSSVASNSGDSSVASNSGYRSVASNSGYSSVAEVKNNESVACALGIKSKAKGKIGCWLVISEWKFIDYTWHRVDTQCVKVDGVNIKEDTYYTLKDGKFVEVNND